MLNPKSSRLIAAIALLALLLVSSPPLVQAAPTNSPTDLAAKFAGNWIVENNNDGLTRLLITNNGNGTVTIRAFINGMVFGDAGCDHQECAAFPRTLPASDTIYYVTSVSGVSVWIRLHDTAGSKLDATTDSPISGYYVFHRFNINDIVGTWVNDGTGAPTKLVITQPCRGVPTVCYLNIQTYNSTGGLMWSGNASISNGYPNPIMFTGSSGSYSRMTILDAAGKGHLWAGYGDYWNSVFHRQ